MPPGFGGYTFAGALRPAPYGPSRMGTVPKSILYPDYAVDSMPHGEINDKRANKGIPVYKPVEIEGMRTACRIGREVLDCGGRAVRAGATCDEIDRVVHEAGSTARARARSCAVSADDLPASPARRARARLPSSAARAVAAQLLQVPAFGVHVSERGHLPRDPGQARARRGRHRQHRRDNVRASRARGPYDGARLFSRNASPLSPYCRWQTRAATCATRMASGITAI